MIKSFLYEFSSVHPTRLVVIRFTRHDNIGYCARFMDTACNRIAV
jgi:hypothetical protein